MQNNEFSDEISKKSSMNQSLSCISDIKIIKQAILKSRYKAVVNVNIIQLSLYFGICKYVSENTRQSVLGTGAIEAISKQLSVGLPGLRGVSSSGIKRMRSFHEAWQTIFANRPASLDDLYLQVSEHLKQTQ